MHPNCPEPAAHSWVDLGLWSCYHHVLGHPKYITTDPSLRLAANARPPNQICCTALSWSWIAELSPPQLGLPQQTTDLSARIAAKAPQAWTCCTLLSWSCTEELSLPSCGSPHVTSDPSSMIAANAKTVPLTWHSVLSCSWTAELSPPKSGSPHVTTDPSDKMAANA